MLDHHSGEADRSTVGGIQHAAREGRALLTESGRLDEQEQEKRSKRRFDDTWGRQRPRRGPSTVRKAERTHR